MSSLTKLYIEKHNTSGFCYKLYQKVLLFEVFYSLLSHYTNCQIRDQGSINFFSVHQKKPEMAVN